MRIINFVLFLLMILFIAVQFNDPDGPLWMAIYSIPAIWAAIAAFRPAWFAAPMARLLIVLSILIAIGGIIYYWPTTPQWWTKDVWWETETAREGMGMMIVGIVTLVAWLGGWRYRSVGESRAIV